MLHLKLSGGRACCCAWGKQYWLARLWFWRWRANGQFVIISAYVIGQDNPFSVADYSGDSSPSGPSQINIVGSTPGYLNNVSGGSAGGAAGVFTLSWTNPQEGLLIGLAVHITDTAGASHSLSSLNDSELSHIAGNLSFPIDAPGFPTRAFAFNAVPSRFANGAAALAAGESAVGGQPFDILLVSQPDSFDFPGRLAPPSLSFWTIDLSSLIGHSDGITAISVTDIGALPEPTGLPLILFGVAGLLSHRRSRADTLPAG